MNYDSIADYVDVRIAQCLSDALRGREESGKTFQIIQAKSRDNSRIPMQWDTSENAGFSTGTPWLKAGKSYKYINVENEIQGPIFTFYQDLIRLRKKCQSFQKEITNQPLKIANKSMLLNASLRIKSY